MAISKEQIIQEVARKAGAGVTVDAKTLYEVVRQIPEGMVIHFRKKEMYMISGIGHFRNSWLFISWLGKVCKTGRTLSA